MKGKKQPRPMGALDLYATQFLHLLKVLILGPPCLTVGVLSWLLALGVLPFGVLLRRARK